MVGVASTNEPAAGRGSVLRRTLVSMGVGLDNTGSVGMPFSLLPSRTTMAEPRRVILSGFADEAANQKTAVQQFAAFAALGLQYYSIRFIDVGDGIKNVMKLTKSEIQKIRHLQDEYGLNVSSIGSPIGKVKLLDVDDGTKNAYVPFKTYLAQRGEEGLRAGPCLRDQADPRVLLLSPPGDRSAIAPGPGRRPARPDRRDLPPLRPDLRPGGGGEPGRRQRLSAGRDLPPGEPSGHGAGLRRREPHRSGLFGGRGARTVPSS